LPGTVDPAQSSLAALADLGGDMTRLLTLVAVLLAPCASLARQATPNVVLIIADDHGWTDYGFMGHKEVRTPHLDRLARQGLVFPRGYVPSSLCCPSLASIITGLYPHQHRITSNDPPIPAGMKPAAFYRSVAFTRGRDVMNRHLEAVLTLPRLLAKKDYLSLQTGKWWQGSYRHGGFSHGMTKGQRHGDDGLDIGRKTMQPIFDFIATARKENKPFFVWYAPMMPHEPHNPPARLLEKYRAKTKSLPLARYWAMIEWFDETCGELLGHLDKHKLTDDTLVLYLADNGWVQNPEGSGFVRSKRSPYDAGVRTPIVVRWPGKVRPGKSEALALSIDLVPTVLAAVGLKPAPAMQGVDLLDDRALGRRKAIFGECFTHNAVDLDRPAANLEWRWLRKGPWKLIVPKSGQGVELYDVAADPHEKSDLAARKPDVVKALRQELDAWWKP
jgi:uncharacterized sulfatase